MLIQRILCQFPVAQFLLSLLGLNIFGNTCYVNSPLQMLRSLSTVWQIHLEKSINDPFAKEFKNIMNGP